MRTRSARRERGGDVAPGFPRRDDRQNGPASSARSRGISAPSRLLRLALLVGILVAGAAAPHDPSVDAAAHVGGDVYALDLLPSRGPALGGTRVTFHGRGFTTDMACQFGPHTILPTSVSPEGDMLVCVTPSPDDVAETLRVLRYAHAAQKLVACPRVRITEELEADADLSVDEDAQLGRRCERLEVPGFGEVFARVAGLTHAVASTHRDVVNAGRRFSLQGQQETFPL